MSIDPNRDLNPIFSEDPVDAPKGPGSDLGNPDMRGVVRRESPGVPPADSTDRVIDDPGVNLPNADLADRVAGLDVGDDAADESGR